MRLFQSCFSCLGVVRSLGEPAASGISAPPFHRCFVRVDQLGGRTLTLSPEVIGGLMLALTGLLSGLASLFSKRSRDLKDDRDRLLEENRELRRTLLLTDTWMFTMSRTLAQNGFKVPDPPKGLSTLGVVSNDESD